MVHYPRVGHGVKHAVSPLQGIHARRWGARSLSLQLAQGIDEQSRGQVRREYQYVTDLLPTLLELTGVERPKQFRGVEVVALDGASFAASLNDSDYLSAHHEQYSEFMVIEASTRTGGSSSRCIAEYAYDDQEWELYDIREDPPSATTSRPNDQNWFASFQQRGSAVRGQQGLPAQ